MSIRKASLLLAAPALLAGLSGCGAPKGELVVAIQTDMSVPADLDSVTIGILNTVTNAEQRFTYTPVGSGGARLPATLAVLAPDEPNQPVRVRVSGRKGRAQGGVLGEVQMIIPEDRTAMVQLPLRFLCDGTAEYGPDESITNNCQSAGGGCDGRGECTSAEVATKEAVDYDPALIFGGGIGNGDGTCFDTAGCFDGGALFVPVSAGIDPITGRVISCTVTLSPDLGGADVNVALATDQAGICGENGCYVAFNADDGAFTRQGDVIDLPPKACEWQSLEPSDAHRVTGVRIAQVTADCPQKVLANPACGPFSVVGSGAPTRVVLAHGEAHPASLALGQDSVYWTRGAFGEDGEVKSAPLMGGTAQVLAEGQHAPRDIAVDKDRGLLVWAAAGTPGKADGALWRSQLDGSGATTLTTGANKPEGVAMQGGRALWTEFGSGNVYREPSELLNASYGSTTDLPFRVAATDDVVCWSNEGSVSIGCAAASGTIEADLGPLGDALGVDLGPPRGLVLEKVGDKTYAYVSFFGVDNPVVTAEWDGSAVVNPRPIAVSQARPSGIAVYGDYVYWTSWGDGTVKRAPKGPGLPTPPEVLAKGQRHPGAIVVGSTGVYWINEGSGDAADGSVVALIPLPAAP